ncbi:MAG: DUF4258 domain-containing protein [Candidatus Methanoperedens sp.]|nr:DUF4258 domain-containing protein [Candidatus Methanoperedens sp.]
MVKGIIRVSEHALKRIKEREVDIGLIEQVLKEAPEVIDVKFGRKAAYRELNGYYLVVIFEEQKDEIVVVTVLKVDDVRLNRYGFNRI